LQDSAPERKEQHRKNSREEHVRKLPKPRKEPPERSRGKSK